MKNFLNKLKKNAGTVSIEYVIIVVLVALVVMGGMRVLGNSMTTAVETAATQITTNLPATE